MGNIQVVRESSRRKPIFNQHNSSQVKTSRSPRHTLMKQENIRRFTNSNRVYKVKQSDGEDTYRHRDSTYYRTNQKKSQHQPSFRFNQHKNQTPRENNRINNFNDFLLEVKKQMNQKQNEHSQASLQFQPTRTIQSQRSNGNQSNKQLKINLRLQNQKFELDKYKKLVQRELSKSHSIQNISLESRQQNQKVLVIKYGEYGKNPNQQKHTNFKEQTQNYASSLTFALPRRQSTPNKHLAQKISIQRKQYLQILQQTQKIMKEMQYRNQTLFKLIKQSDKNVQASTQPHKQQTTNRISRISQLMSDINHLHYQQIKLQSQIKAAIQDDDSQLSESVTLRSSMVIQDKQGSK